MKENYSGSKKIREKSSMCKGHKFLSSEIFRLRIPRTKIVPTTKITISTIVSGKSSTYISVVPC
jgi:hypothetical protein